MSSRQNQSPTRWFPSDHAPGHLKFEGEKTDDMLSTEVSPVPPYSERDLYQMGGLSLCGRVIAAELRDLQPDSLSIDTATAKIDIISFAGSQLRSTLMELETHGYKNIP